MIGKECKELLHVALVGLQRLRRHPALIPEMGQPPRHLGCHLAAGND
jgi:hypothetical protein